MTDATFSKLCAAPRFWDRLDHYVDAPTRTDLREIQLLRIACCNPKRQALHSLRERLITHFPTLPSLPQETACFLRKVIIKQEGLRTVAIDGLQELLALRPTALPPLHQAAQDGDLPLATALLDGGTSPESLDRDKTPPLGLLLQLAMGRELSANQVAIAKLLEAQGVKCPLGPIKTGTLDIPSSPVARHSIIHSNADTEALELELISKTALAVDRLGVGIRLISTGTTLLHQAALAKADSAIVTFLSHGASGETVDSHGRLPIQLRILTETRARSSPPLCAIAVQLHRFAPTSCFDEGRGALSAVAMARKNEDWPLVSALMGHTLLIDAVSAGDAEKVATLLQSPYYVSLINVADANGDSPLHIALRHYSTQLDASEAVTAGPRGRRRGPNETVKAVEPPSPEIIELLLNHRAEPNLVGGKGLTPYGETVLCHRRPQITALFRTRFAPCRLIEPTSLLITAVRRGQLKELRALLGSGVPVNQPGIRKRTALHHAIFNLPNGDLGIRLAVLSLLLDYNATPSARDDQYQTPADYMDIFGVELADCPTLQRWREATASAPKTPRDRCQSVDLGSLRIPNLGLSLPSEPQPNGSRDQTEVYGNGHCAGIKAVFSGRHNTLEMLIESNHAFGTPDGFGRTALMAVVAMGDYKGFRLLMKSGLVDVNQADRGGVTAAHLAALVDMRIYSELLVAGANPYAATIHGIAPWEVAANHTGSSTTDAKTALAQAATADDVASFINLYLQHPGLFVPSPLMNSMAHLAVKHGAHWTSMLLLHLGGAHLSTNAEGKSIVEVAALLYNEELTNQLAELTHI